MSRVYASLPLTGPQGSAGRELVRGAALALERPQRGAGRPGAGLHRRLRLLRRAADRQAVVRAARGTRDRDSILGRYSIDADGHATMTAYGRFAVAGGELVWDAG